MHFLQIFNALNDLFEHLLQASVAFVPPDWCKFDVRGIHHRLLPLRQTARTHRSGEKLFNRHSYNTNLALLDLFLLKRSVQTLLQLLALSQMLL
eukprot:Skav220116  [mRNA]  locus=scaffold1078:767:11109:+ [translate_table: standard]